MTQQRDKEIGVPRRWKSIPRHIFRRNEPQKLWFPSACASVRLARIDDRCSSFASAIVLPAADLRATVSFNQNTREIRIRERIAESYPDKRDKEAVCGPCRTIASDTFDSIFFLVAIRCRRVRSRERRSSRRMQNGEEHFYGTLRTRLYRARD